VFVSLELEAGTQRSPPASIEINRAGEGNHHEMNLEARNIGA